MFLESTTAPPPRKRGVAEGGPLPPRQCGSGRPAGLRARQRLQTSFLKGFIKGLLRLCSILGIYQSKTYYNIYFWAKSNTGIKNVVVTLKTLLVLQKFFPPEKVIVNKSKGTNFFWRTFSEFCVSVSFVFYKKNHHTLFSNHTSIWSRVGVTNQSCESE